MRKFKINVDGEEYVVEVEEIDGGSDTVSSAPKNTPKSTSSKPKAKKSKPKSSAPKKKKSENKNPAASGDVVAPMPGKVLDIKVSAGDEVKAGDVLLILEAMKMENDMTAPTDGIVKEVAVSEGQNVEADEILVKME
ncbi:MAG: biotin/lipoyl-containing protein [Bacillota bacterium]